MPVVKEWQCKEGCGYFESPYPVCVTCGSQQVLRVFLTPPGYKSDKSKFTDRNLRRLSDGAGGMNFTNNASQSHQPAMSDFKDLWQPYNTKNKNPLSKQTDQEEIARISSASGLAPVRPVLPKTSQAQVHKDDAKGKPLLQNISFPGTGAPK